MQIMDNETAEQCQRVRVMIYDFFEMNKVSQIVGFHAMGQILCQMISIGTDDEVELFLDTMRKQTKLMRGND